MEPRFRFTKTRLVESPRRANATDAGIDFFIPNLTAVDLLEIPQNMKEFNNKHIFFIKRDQQEIVVLQENAKLLIPSGIRPILEPWNSMLMAANKSGVSSKEGLLYTAEIVDSPYRGEIHLGIFNSGTEDVEINLQVNKKLIQFIHVPVYLTEPEEIDNGLFEEINQQLESTRGNDGFGSTDNK